MTIGVALIRLTIRRSVIIASTAVLAITLLYFWITPPNQRADWVPLAGLGIVGIGALGLASAFHRALATWRGFGALLALHLLAQLWLQSQWNLWDAPLLLLRNLNVIAGLLAFASLVALCVSLILLLMLRDASVIALAVAWIGYPILFIGAAARYRTMDALSNAPLREQIVWIVPSCALPLLLTLGALAFCLHLIRLLIYEVIGKDGAMN